ncbi:MAG: two-component regulator propeller domain-containing protein [Bacteroidota bacterium]
MSAFFLLCIYSGAKAQALNDWSIFTSFRTVNGINEDLDGNIWLNTSGGIISYNQDLELIQEITNLQGLTNLDVQASVYDSISDQLIVGYSTGALNIIDLNTLDIRFIGDIERNTLFTNKGINKIIVAEDVFVATEFGVVVFDRNDLFVKASYAQFGSFNRGIPVNDLVISRDSIYLATNEGFAKAALGDELVVAANWSIDASSDNFGDLPLTRLFVSDDIIYTSTSQQNYVFDAGWQENTALQNAQVIDYALHPDGIIYLTSQELRVPGIAAVSIAPNSGRSVFLGSDVSKVYIGTDNGGLLQYDIESSDLMIIENSGPFLNFFNDVNIDENGVLYSASTDAFPSVDPFNPIRGYYLFDGSVWRNFNRLTSPELSSANFGGVYVSGDTDSAYYFGSWGSGIARHNKNTDRIDVYNRGNSSLSGIEANRNFIVIAGLEGDRDNNMWATSFDSESPLNVQPAGEDTWIGFPAFEGASTDRYFNLFIDSFNQKWISLINFDNQGLGMLVLDTGDLQDPDDDRFIKLTTDEGSGNLPNEIVKAVIQDQNDEVWIGTERGIARFIFPELLIDGGPNERRAQWLINEDTSAVSRLLLRDVNVSTMAINGANEKWIGSENQGIWVLNEEGSRIERRYTVDNSPLISNNIRSIEVNQETGEVFIATDLGLMSLLDVPKTALPSMDELKVFPNPFRYSQHDRVFIEGLSESTTIHIVGVDGTVVNRFETTGGRVEWDGRDSNGRELGTGVYFIMAVGDGEKGTGKVVIIR